MLAWITDCLTALTISALLVVILERVSPVFALVDHPDRRKQHDGVVPLCGGIAIFSAFTTITLFQQHVATLPINFWAGLFVTLLVGVMDDRNGLSAVKRLAAQFAAALMLVNPLSGLSMVTGLALPDSLLGISFLLLTVVAILFVVGLINSWNMIDGVDGLAGGTAAVALFWLAVIAWLKGVNELILPTSILFAAVCGFLVFNMRSPWCARARIFMGDAGSTALGATIAYLVISLSIQGDIAFSVLLWIVIIPVLDTLSLIVRRLHAGRSPLAADRWHLHHLLLDRKLSPAATTATIVAASTLCGGIGCLGIVSGTSNFWMTIGLLIPFAGHSALVFFASGTRVTWLRDVGREATSQLTSLPQLPARNELTMNYASTPSTEIRPAALSDAA